MKITLPALFPARPKKRLRATAVRRPLRIAATAEYDEMAEPNMKLSRALLIVLVLHVVAVSGIIAFNAIKTRQGPIAFAPSAPSLSTNSTAVTPKTEALAHSSGTTKETPARAETKAAHTPGKTVAKEHAKAAATPESGKIYIVAKGDTPVTIAKKLKVPYDDLLATNHIDDPHKLQIGQKLTIPSKAPKAKKVEE
jgi:LysM repeat protein